MRLPFAVLVLCISFALNAIKSTSSLAPASAEYMGYLSTPEMLRSERYGSHIPERNTDIADPSIFLPSTREFPLVYDLRQMNGLTHIRNQGYTSACWCFSCCAALESRWLLSGYGIYDLSENNIYYGHGYTGEHIGGNRIMSTTYLMRGVGPVLESQDPFQFDTGQYHVGLTPAAFVPEAVWLPQELDISIIKQSIMDYGALDTAMNFSDSFFNSTNNSYYYPGYPGADTNHLVNIVGWDDNYLVAGGTGAWIVRNCWGTDWGDDGYFYVSYHDYFITRYAAYWPKVEAYNSQQQILQYDDVGYIGDWGYGNNTACSLVKYNVPAGYRLSRIGSYTTSSPTNVDYRVYGGFDGVSPTSLLARTEVDTHLYHGFYIKDLSEPLFFNQATSVYVLTRFVARNYGYPLAVEYNLPWAATPPISSNVAWISPSGEDGTWEQVGANTNSEIDFCTKLYITPASASEDNILIPAAFIISPNPARDLMTLSFHNKTASQAEISLYNIKGQLVKKELRSTLASGQHSITLALRDSNGNPLSSGIYLCRLKTSAGSQTRLATVIK
ncbi:MAG: C1 family peptidase [Candidatus Cloacimonetes bacterium]|nr:C1 family peptidase [Candidatus Cloacimonadota bacterium]